MSYKWPSKDPSETLDYSIDWSRLLRTGESITTAIWYANDVDGVKQQLMPPLSVNSLTAANASGNSTITTITLSGGIVNYMYKLFCNVSTTTGAVLERSITLAIKER